VTSRSTPRSWGADSGSGRQCAMATWKSGRRSPRSLLDSLRGVGEDRAPGPKSRRSVEISDRPVRCCGRQGGLLRPTPPGSELGSKGGTKMGSLTRFTQRAALVVLALLVSLISSGVSAQQQGAFAAGTGPCDIYASGGTACVAAHS